MKIHKSESGTQNHKCSNVNCKCYGVTDFSKNGNAWTFVK